MKALRTRKRYNKRKAQLKNKKGKLKKVLKVNLRISSYMNKLKEQFMVDIQSQKISVPDETTFLTLTGDKQQLNSKFYSQQSVRPQHNPFKLTKKRHNKFKFQLPKLRLSIYNEITKDAVKMFHPNIHALTQKARNQQHLDSTLEPQS